MLQCIGAILVHEHEVITLARLKHRPPNLRHLAGSVDIAEEFIDDYHSFEKGLQKEVTVSIAFVYTTVIQ